MVQGQMLGASPDLAEMRLRLHERLRNLQTHRDAIDEEVREIDRRIRLIDEVWSWEPQPPGQQPANIQNGDGRLIGLRLGAAIVRLRHDNPDLTKEEAKKRLEAIAFPFETRHIGRAIHAAWLSANRSLQAAAVNGQ